MHMVLALGATVMSGATVAGGAVAAGATAASGAVMSSFAGLGSMLGIGGSTAATGAAAAATTGSTALSWLSAGSGALGAFSALASGMANKREADAASLQERVAARQEEIIGAQEANELLDSAIDTMARQQLTFGAAGIDAFSGSAKRTTTRTLDKAEKGIRTSEGNTYLSALRRRQSARALTTKGRGALVAGLAEAGSRGLGAVADFKARG